MLILSKVHKLAKQTQSAPVPSQVSSAPNTVNYSVAWPSPSIYSVAWPRPIEAPRHTPCNTATQRCNLQRCVALHRFAHQKIFNLFYPFSFPKATRRCKIQRCVVCCIACCVDLGWVAATQRCKLMGTATQRCNLQHLVRLRNEKLQTLARYHA